MTDAQSTSDPGVFTYMVQCDAETLEGFRKKADLKTRGGEFTIFSDEAATPGMQASAPSPMAYFAASILF